ncbi:MAG TPA: hypothetical protein ENK24_07180 [Anaerolineae bacterium]|nr:hypothetical protein [Anaerolineae bacterium]
MPTNYFELLEIELDLLDKAAAALRYSYDRCREIGVKDVYSQEEKEKFEALTGRFARLSDILIQKTFRLIDVIDLDTEGTVRDRINRAERKELIESAAEFIEIRELRNEIAHEYIPEAIETIFKMALAQTPLLLDSVERVKRYCERYDRPGAG